MDFFALSALVNAVTSAILGGVVLARDPKSRLYSLFSLFAFSVAIWSTFYFLWQLATNDHTALQYVQLFMAAAVFIPFFYFHFVTVFTQQERELLVPTIIGYISAGVFAGLSFNSLFIAEVTNRAGFAYWPVPGPLFHYFLIIWIFYVLYATVLLVRACKHTSGQRRQQILLVLIGMTIGYLGGLTNYFLWYNLPIPPYGNILVSVYVVLVTYAIIRLHLFNVKVILAELVVLVLWVATLIRVTLSESTKDLIINGLFLLFIMVLGTFLIINVRREVRAKEKIGRLANDLEKANKRLQLLDRMKSEFVSIASHQLRNPIAAIRGYTSMLQEGDFGKLPTQASEPLQRINDSARQMAYSIEDYLNISRIESGNMKYDLTDFNLRQEVERVCDDMRPEAIRKGLSLLFRTDLHSKGIVHADRFKTVQILQNLVNNAIKYTETGHIKILMRDDVTTKQVFIDVMDTGIGLSQESVAHLFTKFNRADNASAITGTGLGLYVAKQMAQAMSGDITVSSDGEGKGSCFTVRFPLAL